MLKHKKTSVLFRPVGAIFISTSLTFCFSAELNKKISSSQDLGKVLYASSRQILLVTPYLRSKDIAEAIRRAAVERGVKVFIITDVANVKESSGYMPSLSFLKGVQIRIVRNLSKTYAIVDQKNYITGPLLKDVENPMEFDPTLVSTKNADLKESASWFAKIWPTAFVYKFDFVKQPKNP